MLAIERHPNGPRVRAFGQRIHHGAIGCVLVAVPNKYTRIVGVTLVAHDIHDWRIWFMPGAQKEAIHA